MPFKVPKIVNEPVVPGRTALIDADCVAYYGAAGCDDLPLRSATRRIDLRMKQIITETRADKYVGYLTGKNNFRDLVATLQRYKGNRYDKDGRRITAQPDWLQECRIYLQTEWKCKLVHGQEADDALSIAQTDESVISTIDKDLRINQGMHHDMTSGELSVVKGFGDLWMSGSQCKGTGLKFFCAQLLMGDTADSIKGLPKVTQMMKDEYGVLRLGGCGPKAAYLVVNECDNYNDALARVIACYYDYWKDHGYKHWRTGKVYKAGRALAYAQLLEQGRLLWMRQSENEIWTPELLSSENGE